MKKYFISFIVFDYKTNMFSNCIREFDHYITFDDIKQFEKEIESKLSDDMRVTVLNYRIID